MEMKKFTNRKKFILFPLLALAFLSLVSFVVMQLWNHLLPDILNVSSISFWQAMGIFILCKILFGFGRGGRMGPPWMRRGMSERFGNMTPEEKQRFREEMKTRMCWTRPSRETESEQPDNEPNAPGA
jgi:hypothetical protein